MPDDSSIWGRPGVPRPRPEESGIGGKPPRPSETVSGGGPRPTRSPQVKDGNPSLPLRLTNPPTPTRQAGNRPWRKVAIGAAGVVVVPVLLLVAVSRGSSPSTIESPAESSSRRTPSSVVAAGAQPAPKSDSPAPSEANPPSGFEGWEQIARSVVFIEADGSACGWTGSGSIVGDGSYVLTNQHVAGDGECDLTVWLTDSTSAIPTEAVQGTVVISDSQLDLAILQLRDSTGRLFGDRSRAPIQFAEDLPKLGDKLTILGYPGIGGSTITLTSGDYSGIDNSEDLDFLKTTANMNPGVSGGVALNSQGKLVGIPTAGRGAEIVCEDSSDCVANGSTIGLLRPAKFARELLTRAQGMSG